MWLSHGLRTEKLRSSFKYILCIALHRNGSWRRYQSCSHAVGVYLMMGIKLSKAENIRSHIQYSSEDMHCQHLFEKNGFFLSHHELHFLIKNSVYDEKEIAKNTVAFGRKNERKKND